MINLVFKLTKIKWLQIIFSNSIFLISLLITSIVLSKEKNLTFFPGKIFRDCLKCPELIVVKPGTFIMGSDLGRPAEKPAHTVNIPYPFAIGRFEVTFREWSQCVENAGCRHRPDDHKWGQIRRPVINITWDQAKTYLRWLSSFTDKNYRLPSESEWEYIHKAGTSTRFWWGNSVGINNANCKDCKSNWSAKSTAPVGSFKANPFGVFDTAGNAFEWVEDCWHPNHFNTIINGSPRLNGNCHFRVIRGGSFYYFGKVSESSYRAKNPFNIKSYWLGFRVLRELK